MIIREIRTDQAPQPIGAYSQAVVAKIISGIVFISGQRGVDPKTGQLVDEGIDVQAMQALHNLQAIAKEAKAKVVKTTVLLADIAEFERVNEIYASYAKQFSDKLPARAAFQVAALPANAKIEIEAIAVV